ncbi:predicted protein [Coccidioides posadasii str. Silveira]|uniref:Predicted protein n=2 Tax=Coccidioides posadasii TaxID=199306 RepID=E9DDY1_COCPS|nr:predicted protein [Coccidioides posadasii str. Silveira]KMM70236.1 hypothetical protein CPAG_06548 [Coccidioides posadasii RMSCC 3488]
MPVWEWLGSHGPGMQSDRENVHGAVQGPRRADWPISSHFTMERPPAQILCVLPLAITVLRPGAGIDFGLAPSFPPFLLPLSWGPHKAKRRVTSFPPGAVGHEDAKIIGAGRRDFANRWIPRARLSTNSATVDYLRGYRRLQKRPPGRPTPSRALPVCLADASAPQNMSQPVPWASLPP